jgi:predicted transcriptional regulator
MMKLKKGSRKYTVLFVLCHLGWISLPQLCKLLGAKRQTTTNNIITELSELERDGLLERSERGLYQITTKGASAVTMENISSMSQILANLRKLWEEG